MNDPDKSIFPGVPAPDGAAEDWRTQEFGKCGCYACVSNHLGELGKQFFMPFIVCSDCGNKRCPKATHHGNDCTNSNEPGQEGSRYGAIRETD